MRASSRPARGATVEDLGSTNGTYVNDQPITGALELEPATGCGWA